MLNAGDAGASQGELLEDCDTAQLVNLKYRMKPCWMNLAYIFHLGEA